MARIGCLFMFALVLIVPSVSFAQGSDTTPPTLVEFAFTPESIDITDEPQAVTVTGWATDDPSGVNSLQVGFRSPTGIHYQSGTVNTTLDAPSR